MVVAVGGVWPIVICVWHWMAGYSSGWGDLRGPSMAQGVAGMAYGGRE